MKVSYSSELDVSSRCHCKYTFNFFFTEEKIIYGLGGPVNIANYFLDKSDNFFNVLCPRLAD
jgi:hypothetical protein